jgi:outer membrane protein assembly factor BamB
MSQARRTLLLALGLVVLGSLLSGCATGATLASSWPGVTADESTAFIAYNNSVIAVNLENGVERWHYPAEPDRNRMFYAAPLLTPDGQLIVGGYDHTVTILDAENGAEIWRFTEPAARIIGAATLAGSLALIPSADHHLYALDLETRQVAWAFEAEHALWAAPLVDGERVYLPSIDHHLYALRLSDGAEIWRADLGGGIVDTPTLVEGVLLAGTFGQGLRAVDAETGEILWSFETVGWIWGNPTVVDGTAYFGDVAGWVYSLRLGSSGEEIRRFQPDGAVASSPAVADDRVYISTESGTIYARAASTGDPLWEQSISRTSRLYTDPIVVGETLLVASTTTRQGEVILTAFDAASGARRWTYPVAPAEE